MTTIEQVHDTLLEILEIQRQTMAVLEDIRKQIARGTTDDQEHYERLDAMACAILESGELSSPSLSEIARRLNVPRSQISRLNNFRLAWNARGNG